MDEQEEFNEKFAKELARHQSMSYEERVREQDKLWAENSLWETTEYWEERRRNLFILSGSDYEGQDLTDQEFVAHDFHKANLRMSVLDNINGKSINITKSDLGCIAILFGLKPHFYSEKKYMDFSEADLSGASLKQAKLADANFSRALMSQTDFSGANLTGANFSQADLTGANFSRADLSYAIFQFANLKGVDLTGAKVDNADFEHANLENAILHGVDLRNIKYLNTANLQNADLKGAYLPDGWHGRYAPNSNTPLTPR